MWDAVQEVKPEEDWKRTTLTNSWSNGGQGNPFGEEVTAGGEMGGASWPKNRQYQISLQTETRCFLFLELLEVKTDMRDEKGLQTSPSYPTIGFSVFAGKGNHVLLEPSHQPEALFACEMKASDGVCLEPNHRLSSDGDKGPWPPLTVTRLVELARHVTSPAVEHKYSVTLYTDQPHLFELIDPSLGGVHCVHCSNPSYMPRVLHKLSTLEAKMKRLETLETEVRRRQLLGGLLGLAVEHSVGSEEGEGFVTASELARYTARVQEQAQEQHAGYITAIAAANDENAALEAHIHQVRETMRAGIERLTPAQKRRLAMKREIDKEKSKADSTAPAPAPAPAP
ncbi:MAG: hypothetical protein SGPRY_007116 [Prymnesium sp.]